ncbi:MAG TPA: VanW family protein [Chloroflexaceae bacterium]|nr:VanW family protein [Chloroflexaceae bacterium]
MRRTLVLLALLVSVIAPAAPAAAQTAPAESFAFFPETGHNVGLQIKRFFDAHGGVATFGPPLTELIVGADGLQVQYFERARFEYRPTAPVESRVSITRAGAMLAEGRGEPAFQWLAASPDPARTFFPESGHTIGGAFGWFWQTRGGLAAFGYPVSEELREWDEAAGAERLVQYFERARFEYRPELAGAPGEVTLSPVGRWLLERDPVAMAATPPARPITLLGQATTGYATSSYERVTNIARSTAMVDGIIVPAGAEFSFNSVGDFSEANGFVEGYGIVGGRLERVIGGGLCQVSTTLFRAVSNAGLQITRRVGHSHIVNFYENILGFDATVFVPSVDFRWRNDTSGPVYIVGVSDPASARVTFQLYGHSDGRSVRYQGPVERNWKQPGAAVWQLDRSLPPGTVRQMVHGRPGVDVTYTRIITHGDGTTRVEPFHTHYKPWENFFVYGPGVTPPAGVKVIAPKG